MFPHFSQFRVPGNQFSGTLPESICDWKVMNYFQVYSNKFSGNLPDCLQEWTRLIEFYTWGNRFTGTISDHWCNSSPNMTIFDIRNNSMHGTIPPCLWALPKLQLLVVDQNQFTGEFFLSEDLSCGSDSSLHYSPSIVYITASDNNLTGIIPSCIGRALSKNAKSWSVHY